jgi:hypothetical protein
LDAPRLGELAASRYEAYSQQLQPAQRIDSCAQGYQISSCGADILNDICWCRFVPQLSASAA